MSNYIIKFIARISRYLSKSRVEPSVKQKCDRLGNVYWQVDDPVSATRCCFGSEQEVRAWLDRRYYLG